MDSLDDFIQYNDFDFKPNSLFDQDFSLSSPFSEHSEAHSQFPAFLPKTIKNLLDPEEDSPRKQSYASEASSASNKQTIMKKKDEIPEISEVNESEECAEATDYFGSPIESEPKINTRSKKIQKREKPEKKGKTPKGGKQSKAAKQKATEALLSKVDSRFIPEGFDDPDLDDKTKKKMIQMIRNRVSAQTSRDRKKAYMNQVEDLKERLTGENTKLSKENTILLERVRKLEQENEALKRTSGSLCSKCGYTLQCESPSGNQETDDTSLGRSNTSSPLRRGGARGGLFGFSMAFAAIVCFMLFMNGGSMGDFTPQGSKMKKMKPTFQFVSRMLDTAFNAPTCDVNEKDSYMQEEKPVKSEMEVLEELESTFKDIEFGQMELLGKIKPLMEQFDIHHQNLFKTFENTSSVVNLSQNQHALLDSSRKITDSKNGTFLGKDFIVKKNKTSTVFCPSGFEFYRNSPKDDIEEEIANHPTQSNTLTRRKTIDVEKAEYIQLLLPKHAIGRVDMMDSSNGTNLPAYQKFDEDSSLIEVWCKVFAIRDLSNLATNY